MQEEESRYCVCYYAEQNAKSIALNLLTFGNEIFAKTYHVNNFKLLKEINEIKQQSSYELMLSKLNPFIFENLIDSIKISICLENYMKAKLLLNGFIIHRISGDHRFKTLKQNQAKRPIELAEIKKVCRWEKYKETEDFYLDALTHQTIQFNIILNKPKYQKYIGLPSNIKDIVSKINEHRNSLHFLTGLSATYGQQRIDELSDLMDFVNMDYRILQNELVDELGESSEKKIKKRHANN